MISRHIGVDLHRQPAVDAGRHHTTRINCHANDIPSAPARQHMLLPRPRVDCCPPRFIPSTRSPNASRSIAPGALSICPTFQLPITGDANECLPNQLLHSVTASNRSNVPNTASNITHRGVRDAGFPVAKSDPPTSHLPERALGPHQAGADPGVRQMPLFRVRAAFYKSRYRLNVF